MCDKINQQFEILKKNKQEKNNNNSVAYLLVCLTSLHEIREAFQMQRH